MASGVRRSKQGTYVGSGVSRDLDIDFNVTKIDIFGPGLSAFVKKFSCQAGDDCIQVDVDSGLLRIQTIDAVTLGRASTTLGTHVSVNSSATAFHYIAHE